MDFSPAEEEQFKETQAEILTREIDTNEYIPELRQLITDSKSITGAINYLHGQLQTFIQNTNNALQVSYDAKAVVDTFMENPPKDGKSAYEVANSLRPEGSKFKSEMEWINSLGELKGEALQNTLGRMRIFVESSLLTVRIFTNDWRACEDANNGFTFTIRDEAIKKNQEIQLVNCETDTKAFFKILAQLTCDSISDGEMVIHIPKCRDLENANLGFYLVEYVLKGGDE